MFAKIILLTFFIFHIWPIGAMAAKFRYLDGNGMLNHVDDYYSIPEEYRDQIKNFTPPEKPEIKAVKNDIEVYMTSWCPYCKKLIAFLNEKGIPYKKYDIENDPLGGKKYRALGGNGVPLTKIGKNLISGYNPEAILRLSKYGKNKN